MAKMSPWFVILYLLPLQLQIVAAQQQTGFMNKLEGCSLNKCGDVDIPYPFGIGPNCAYNHSFDITCKNNSTPFLTQLNLVVADLTSSFYQHIIYVYPFKKVCSSLNTSVVQSLLSASTTSNGPYIFPPDYFNYTLMVKGCDASVSTMSTTGSVLEECTLACNNNKSSGDSVFQMKLAYLNTPIHLSINSNDQGCVQMGVTDHTGD